MTWRLILNPGSRGGRGRLHWRAWEERLDRTGAALDRRPTASLDHARELARDGAGDVVVAVGGDGTINAVLDGLLQSPRPDRPMGVLYAGTSPDFCRFHGIPTDPDGAVQALLARRPVPVDVGRIEWTGPDGRPRAGHFGCSVNVGLGAAIARAANRWRRRLGDRAGTGLAALCAVLRARTIGLRISIDGAAPREARLHHLAILKNPRLASGLRLDLALRPDDGRLYAVEIAARSRPALLGLLPRFYTGRASAHPAVAVRTAGRIRVEGPGDVELEFDGDPRGGLPASVEIRPRLLNLLGARP
jgi:diacylglycerol kinase family enzyme